MIEIITNAFNGEVKRLFAGKEEIRNHILNHERKNLCIENLTREIKTIEFKNAVKLDRDRIESLAKEFARSFAKISLNFHEEQHKSTLQKRKERLEREEDEYFERLFDGEIEEKDFSHGI